MKKALKFFELVYRMVKPVVRNKDNLEAEEEPGVDLGQVVFLEAYLLNKLQVVF